MFKSDSIFSVLKPVFYSTKILGFSPFNLSENNAKIFGLDLIWSISLMLGLGGFAFFSLSTRIENKALITKVTDYLHTHLCVISMCGGIFFACIYRKDIVGIISEMSLLDKQINMLDLPFNLKEKYRKHKIYISLVTFVLWIYITALFILDIKTFTKGLTVVSAGEVVAYGGPMITVFVELQFCVLVFLLKERFSWLNGKMIELGKVFGTHLHLDNKKRIVVQKINAAPYKVPQQLEKNKVLATMHQISIYHHDLCSISKKLNNAYSFQILLIIIQAFMTIIAVSFYFAKLSFSNALNEMSTNQRSYYANMIILNMSAIMIVVVICSNTTKEAQKTGILLHNVISLDVFIQEGNLDLGVACFSLQLLHHNVKFTACKLFPIDETLIYSIVGAATTYLVIVLQFELGVTGNSSGGKQDQQCLNYTINSTLTH